MTQRDLESILAELAKAEAEKAILVAERERLCAKRNALRAELGMPPLTDFRLRLVRPDEEPEDE